MRSVLFGLAMCMASSPALSQGAERCQDILEKDERLACYDYEIGVNVWAVTPYSGGSGPGLARVSTTQIEGCDVRAQPALALMCDAEQISFVVIHSCQLAETSRDNIDLLWRVDDDDVVAATFAQHTDRNAFGFWDTGRAVRAMENLRGRQTFTIHFSPEPGAIATYAFDVRGVETMLDQVNCPQFE